MEMPEFIADPTDDEFAILPNGRVGVAVRFASLLPDSNFSPSLDRCLRPIVGYADVRSSWGDDDDDPGDW